jgi:GT2 family glycosyltransferase
MSVTVAVIIPTYNRGSLVRRAIESVLAQTRPADEIIVVDDGSTDDTHEVVESYGQVRLISKPNGGLSSARNAGVEASNSEWLAFLDDDDWFSPEMLSNQVAAIRCKPHTDLSYTATVRVDATGRELNRTHVNHRQPTHPLRSMVRENFAHPSAVCIRRSAIASAGLFDTNVRLCEDVDLWLRLAAAGAIFTHVSRPLAYITKHSGSMSSSGRNMAQATLDVLERNRPKLSPQLQRPDGREWWLAGAHYRLGRAYWHEHDLEKAVEQFNLALACDPRHLHARSYAWVARHGGMANLFWVARSAKRGALRMLRKVRLLETRWT